MLNEVRELGILKFLFSSHYLSPDLWSANPSMLNVR